ncbi:MAG: stage II sporulation protein SpoIID, partial [Firmicutes bacterium]|nr:stage II sporulation protein SpoIID [Bacillota bacterium]
MDSRSRTKTIVVIALVAAGCLALVICWPGGRKGTVRKFAEEPTITVYIKEEDKKEEMPIEEYIAGVVAGEMKPNWPLEAYAAQA